MCPASQYVIKVVQSASRLVIGIGKSSVNVE